jgi:hypothetical protein
MPLTTKSHPLPPSVDAVTEGPGRSVLMWARRPRTDFKPRSDGWYSDPSEAYSTVVEAIGAVSGELFARAELEGIIIGSAGSRLMGHYDVDPSGRRVVRILRWGLEEPSEAGAATGLLTPRER